MTKTVLASILDEASITPKGITLSFESKAKLNSTKFALWKFRERELNRIVKQHIDLMAVGVIDATVPWPLTGWEDLGFQISTKDLTLWIGKLTLAQLGVVEVRKGKDDDQTCTDRIDCIDV